MPSASIRVWAQRLLTAETLGRAEGRINGSAVDGVCEKLRMTLTPFVGADGFHALMRRALALAKVESPSLQRMNVTAEGRLQRMEGVLLDDEQDTAAAIAITAHLLQLLVTFIGDPLTLRLIRGAWPDASDPTNLELKDL